MKIDTLPQDAMREGITRGSVSDASALSVVGVE